MKEILVIIPKNNIVGVRGIGLLEWIHKLISQIINLHLSKVISFCKEVCGFCKKQGTFTAVGETKLQIQIAVHQSDILYQVYLDLRISKGVQNEIKTFGEC